MKRASQHQVSRPPFQGGAERSEAGGCGWFAALPFDREIISFATTPTASRSPLLGGTRDCCTFDGAL